MKTKIQTLKTNKIFLTSSILTTLLVIVLFTSCKKAEPKDPEEVATDQNEAKFEDNNKKENDAEFLVAAASINLEEIELGNLALTKAQSQEVKDFGKMMVDGHTKSLNELKGLATTKQITIPQQLTDEGKELYSALSEEKGKDFDKKYVDKMVKGHKDAISKFEKAANDSKDPDVKAWASATLPDLNMHLEHAVTLQEKLDKK
jgi:putative membrane protein